MLVARALREIKSTGDTLVRMAWLTKIIGLPI